MAEEDGELISDYESILQRHKNEKKELQAKIQSLKHSVPKGDKKKKKEVTIEIALLEAKLEEHHKQEINELSDGCNNENFRIQLIKEKIENLTILKEAVNDIESEIIPQINSLEIKSNPDLKITRAQKRRDKKASLEKEREQRIKEAEAENVHSARNVEQEKLKALLMPMGLTINEVPPDGHCLYNAIAEQIHRINIQHDYKCLRDLAAKYMMEHQDEFLPFLINQQTGDCYSPEQFVKYCEDVSKTAAWGGQLEIQAISNCLKLPVKIFQAVGPVIEIGKQYDNKEILLSYHRHAYGLGEHYNSVVEGTNW